MNQRFSFALTALAAAALSTPASADPPLPHRVFASSYFQIDTILARPYDSDVPFGASGDRVWATSPQGWGFRDGVQLVYVTNLDTFDLVVNGGGINYIVDRAEYHPSHVHLIGAPGTTLPLTATASFTFSTDKVDNPLTRPFRPEKRWTCWSSGKREDWYAVDLLRPRVLTGLDVYFYDDQPEGGCAPPENVTLELYRDGGWHAIALRPFTPQPGKNTLLFASGQPERAEQVRLTFRNRGQDKYTGLYGFEPHYAPAQREEGREKREETAPPNAQHPTPNLQITGDKWITQDDVLVSRLTVTNPTAVVQPFFVRMDSELSGTQHGYADEREATKGFPLYLVATGFDGKTRDTHFLADLKPGETRTFLFACAVGKTPQEAQTHLYKLMADPDPLKSQTAAYQSWFDTNIAYFTCSDPLIRKMYYHRWYNLKKNSMDPQLGALQHRTFSEGRWTADWYANVISYGAGHQIREARWLRDPSYAWGHLQTWTDNPRPDGIYPSHVTPRGQQGGQYTDWITSTAWDLYLVHPDRSTLARIADTLARNAEGWRKVYGWDDSPLLVVDSHWWTGMEWQPSFFSFAGYQTGGGSGTDPSKMTPLRRVDLTAYNFGNAQAVAHIYRELGRDADAARLQKLADATRDAVLAQMWDPATHWFHSLRASDNAKSPAKEIIGLYPFTFDLPPANKGYEAAWEVALDPALFWTAWPLASASQDCPAYSQSGWPVGPGGSGCMWNGPSWPHANSLVMTAMANVLRHYAPCALTRQKLYDLFASFTRAQYKNQDPTYPWTGEFYNGDTGQWKTPQRDYNHSTWIDPLINDLIGLVPRPDETLEIDPLLPAGAWSYYVLDGQAYKNHDVTVAYDAQGGHVAPDLKGFAVYLDGKPIYHADRPTHLLYDMTAHKLLAREASRKDRHTQ
jgi:hypothetical protein